MSDLKTPERRDTEEEKYAPESSPEQPTEKPVDPLDNIQVLQGNIDLVQTELLHRIFHSLKNLNKTMLAIAVMLDKRLPRAEEEVKEEAKEEAKEE